jgi:hypothetical protein
LTPSSVCRINSLDTGTKSSRYTKSHRTSTESPHATESHRSTESLCVTNSPSHSAACPFLIIAPRGNGGFFAADMFVFSTPSMIEKAKKLHFFFIAKDHGDAVAVAAAVGNGRWCF